MKENKVYIGLGSNLGDREDNLDKAIEELEKWIKVTQKSKVYETEPVDCEGDFFFNMVVEGETKLSPEELLEKLQQIEILIGRKKVAPGRLSPESKKRTQKLIKYSARTIDLDILLFNTHVVDSSDLKIPHPEIQNRNFVLAPLTDIAPSYEHPVLKKTIEEIYKNSSSSKKIRLWTKKK